MKLPVLNAKQVIRILKKKGFVLVRQSGSHVIFRHADGRRTTVPIHGTKDLGPGLISQILKDCSISEEDINKYK
jgi:predicted RNA binding protein YcfA (HicA-like mRNA interferase family)